MTQLEITNLALRKLGEPKITAMNATTPAAQAATDLYQPTLDSLVRKYRWNFARKSVVLEPVWVAATSIYLESADVLRVNKVAHGLVVGQRVLLDTSDYPDANGHFVITAVSANHFHVSAPGAANVTSSLGKYHVAPQHTWAYKIALPADCLALRTVNGYEANRPHEFYTREGNSIFTNADSLDVVYTEKMTENSDESLFDVVFIQAFACMLAAELAMPVTGAISRRNDMMEMFNQEITTGLMSNVFERRDPNVDRVSGTSYETRIYGE